MKLNTDVRQLVKAKQEVYPTKGTMNLYYKQDRTTAPATVMLYVLFSLVVLLALSKVLIYDPWNEVQQLERQAEAAQAENNTMMAELADYEAVHQMYIRSIETEREAAQVEPTAVLDLIDQVVRPVAAISQVSVVDNQVILTFSGVSLSRAAELVAQLEQSPLVAGASVDTATSTVEQQEQVEIQIYLTLAGEEVTEP